MLPLEVLPSDKTHFKVKKKEKREKIKKKGGGRGGVWGEDEYFDKVEVFH